MHGDCVTDQVSELKYGVPVGEAERLIRVTGRGAQERTNDLGRMSHIRQNRHAQASVAVASSPGGKPPYTLEAEVLRSFGTPATRLGCDAGLRGHDAGG